MTVPVINGTPVQIDAAVQTGTLNTVTLPATGHVLSLPYPVEGLVGYAMRVSTQAGGDPQTVGGLFMLASQESSYGDGSQSHWPATVDQYFNPKAYMTPDQLAALAQPTLSAWTGQGTFPASALTGGEKMYLYNAMRSVSGGDAIVTSVLSGTGAEVAGVINWAAYSGIMSNGSVVGPNGQMYDGTVSSAFKAAVDAATAKATAAVTAAKVADQLRDPPARPGLIRRLFNRKGS